VGLPAVGFDGEAGRRPVEVGLAAFVVEGNEGVTDQRLRQAGNRRASQSLLVSLGSRAVARARIDPPRSLCTVAARSSSVRATVVIGMLWWLVVSRASRERDRCRRMPAAPCRLAGAVTSTRAPP